MTTQQSDLDQLCINTIRLLSVDAVEQANSGHPGLPLGAAPLLYTLYTRFLRFNPKNPEWFNRDRFIMSPGHGSAVVYALLHLTGYDMSLDDIKHFRQLDSKTPGHPEYGIVPGVETTTGPLGQGFAMGVGMAVAEAYLAKTFNRDDCPLIDHYTYALVSDGDLMEGIAAEAASLAGHLKLGKLIYLYDDNDISIDGSTDLTFTEDVAKRFESYDWHVQAVNDGNDIESITSAIVNAQHAVDKPSLIIVRTHIGFGSPKQDTAGVHGSPLGADAVKATKQFFGFPVDKTFYIPKEAADHMITAVDTGAKLEKAWTELFEKYKSNHPDDAKLLYDVMTGKLPQNWDADLNAMTFPADKKIATRSASGKIMNTIAKRLPTLVGGSADLGSSVKTILGDTDIIDCSAATKTTGRNMYFGVREHAMGAMVNGMALHGGMQPFGSTFFVFSDYMRPAIRLAALMEVHSIFVFSHDSIGLGEDGPTHQPVEHLMSLRAMPNLLVIRPADANETVEAWRIAVEHTGPVALILTRQNILVLDQNTYAPASNLKKGAYVLSDCDGPAQGIIIATGSEVELAIEAQKRLNDQGFAVRVVSMPSWELFEMQSGEYRASVLPPDVPLRLAVEAGATLGWERYVGDRGAVIGMTTFGCSGPAEELFAKYGFSADHVYERMKAMLDK